MASWVITISQDYPQHWNSARQHGIWDTRCRQPIETGDLVYFWQGGGSWLGKVRVTRGWQELEPGDHQPWVDADTGSYLGRFEFSVVSDQPSSQPQWGKEVRPRLNKGVSLQSPRQFTDPGDEAVLAGYFPVGTDVDSDAHDRERQRELERVGMDVRRYDLRSIVLRRGQSLFRSSLLNAYEGRCAVTGIDATEVLEAAHISPYKGEHTNHVFNGLLLRADIHTLFDLNALTVTPDHTVHVAPAVRESDYGRLHQGELRVPQQADLRPHPDLLAKHNARCYWLVGS